ncbi:MAG: hypothetical protein ACXVEE_21545 [Polyangiales bacterium]
MRSVHRLFGIAVFTVGLSLVGSPSTAMAAPGTCKCNSGCHANPGQCVKGTGCGVGYAPSCGYRDGDAGAMCPMVGYISCNGDCSCVPIPGFCETVGGADYCDSGVPDSGTTDSGVKDGSVGDSSTGVDSGIKTDSAVTDTGKPPTDSGKPPADSGTTVDSCVPLDCPMGTKTVVVPGECDPFCAQPCGGGEFKCSAHFTCDTSTGFPGFCVPDCLLPGKTCDPAKCESCDISSTSPTAGTCFADLSTCGGDGGADGSDLDGAATDDGGATDGSTDLDGAAADDAGDGTNFADADTGNNGGCGCTIPRTERSDLGLAAVAAGLALIAARRRKH